MNRSWKSVFLIGIMIFTFLPGCIRDYLNECEDENGGGIRIVFYSKSPCETDSVFPSYVRDITIGVFNEGGILVTHYFKKNIILSKNYVTDIVIPSGLYSVMAWSGIMDEPHFETYELRDGITPKNSLLFRLSRDNQNVVSAIEDRVYHGDISVMHSEEMSARSEYTSIGVNILEITNRFTVNVIGFSNEAGDYEVIIDSNNGSMNIDGSIATDRIVEYEPDTVIENGILTAKFTLLKLDADNSNILIIRNKTSRVELFRGDLLATLLLKHPDLDLECDHDFTIDFVLGNEPSIITEIWVNNWLVHSYSAEF